VAWVERTIKKHESLATDKLVLVSWSGFTDGARRRANAEPQVLVVVPELVIENGTPVARDLYADEVTLSARKAVFVVDAGGDVPTRVAVLPDNVVHKVDGAAGGTAQELASSALNQPALIERVLREMHDHPEREDVEWFVVGFPLPEQSLALRKEPDGELHPIRVVEISGEITWSQQRVNLEVKKFGEVVFGHGRAVLGGRRALMVATLRRPTFRA
jgi:hypothetical protein